MSSGLRALYSSPLRGLPISPGLTMFNSPVHPLSQSLCRDSVRGNRYPRVSLSLKGHEGVSFALPGMGSKSHLPIIRLTELQTIGCHICPDVGEKCCGAGDDLAECLGILQVPIADDDGFIQNFWRLRPDSPGAVAFVATWRGEYFLCHLVPSVPGAQKRNLLSDPVFQQEDLFAPATLDAARHAARDVSVYKGSQSRPSMPSETT